MNVVRIKIADQEIDFAFGLGFLGEAFDDLDISFEEVQISLKKNPFKIVPSLMYHSAKYAKKRKKEEPDFTHDEMIDLIDSAGGVRSPGFLLFIQSFTESLLKGVPVDETPGPQVEVKKK